MSQVAVVACTYSRSSATKVSGARRSRTRGTPNTLVPKKFARAAVLADSLDLPATIGYRVEHIYTCTTLVDRIRMEYCTTIQLHTPHVLTPNNVYTDAELNDALSSKACKHATHYV